MTTGVACPPVILQFFDNRGNPLVGGSILTQVGGVNAAVYSDSALTTALPNPVPLNSRGEVSTAEGDSSQMFLTPNTVYTFTASDANGNQIWVATYVNGAQVDQAAIGELLWPQTAAEQAADITPINYFYEPLDVRRYGADPTGVADSSTALANAALVANYSASAGNQNGATISIPSGVFKYTGSGITLGQGVSIAGAGMYASIINFSGANVFTYNGATNITAFTRIADIGFIGTDTISQAITLNQAHCLIIERCYFYGQNNSDSIGIYFENLVEDCVVRDCLIYIYGDYGIKFAPNVGNNNNLIERCALIALADTAWGIYIPAGCDQNVIRNCDLDGANFTGTVGINVSGSTATLIIGNYSESCSAGAIVANSGAASNLSIIANSLTCPAAASAVIVLDSSSPNDNVLVMGNEFVSLGVDTYSAIGVLLGTTTNFTCLNNCATGGGTYNILSINGVAQTDQDAIYRTTNLLLGANAKIAPGGAATFLQLVSSFTGGGRITQGSGAPNLPNGNPVAGDIYFRTDAPSTADQRIYICTVSGATPTWVGIV